MKINILKICTLILIVTGFSCSEEIGREKLRRLEAEREELNLQIDQLKKELSIDTKKDRKVEVMAVKTEKLALTEFNHFIEIQGNIESDMNILVPFQSSGVMKQKHVQEGDKVKKGQLLGELDADVILYGIEELHSRLELAVIIFERQERLWNKKIGSEIDFLKAKNDKDNLEKQLKTLEEQLAQTRVYSPISGTIDAVLVKENEAVQSGQGVFRIVRLDDLKIIAQLSESYIGNVSKGDEVKVFVPVLNDTSTMKISDVGRVIDPDDRTFRVEIKLKNTDKRFLPNMLTILTINDYSNKESVVIRNNVIQNTGNNSFVFVAENSGKDWKARKRQIHTGYLYKDVIEVVSGLKAGEYLITMGFQNLADNQEIKVKR